MQGNQLCFSNTSGEQSEKAIKEIVPFTLACKRTTYLGVNLAMEVRELDTKFIKYCRRKLKAKINGRTSWVHGWEDNTTQSSYRVQDIPHENSSGLPPPPARNEKADLEIHVEFERAVDSQNCLEKEEQSGTHTVPVSKFASKLQ